MRITIKILIGLILIGAMVGLFKWQFKAINLKNTKVVLITATPDTRSIVNKKIIAGNLGPEKEVNIMSPITGIIDKLYVKIGDYIKQGMPIAKISPQSKLIDIEYRKHAIREAEIKLKEAQSKYLRSKKLFSKKIISKEAYESSCSNWEIAKEQLEDTRRQLDILQKGYTQTKIQGKKDNIIYATTKGVVLALPLKEGSTVIENISSKGAVESTIATIADMDKFVFNTTVDEKDIAYLKEGMRCEASLRSYPKEKFIIQITKIALKSDREEAAKGNVKFPVEGNVIINKHFKLVLRSGYMATMEIVVEKAHNVLAIKEEWLHDKGEQYFVWTQLGPQRIKKIVELGISDGIYTEVKSGLTKNDQIIINNDSN